MEALISPDLMKRLEQLQLLARRRSKSTAKGNGAAVRGVSRLNLPITALCPGG